MRSPARSISALAFGVWLASVCSMRAQDPRLSPRIVNTLGSLTGDLVFNPVAPCRIFDTRAGSGIQGQGTGPLAAGAKVSLQVANGLAVTCGVPYPDAKAAVLNFIAVGAAGPGDLRAWPWDSSNPAAPNASVLNYARQVSLAGLNIANGVVVPICNTVTATGLTCSQDLFLQPDVGATHVVIDVLGYFAAPAATPLQVTTVSTPFTAAAVGGSFFVSALCPAGYAITGGGIDHGSYVLPGVNILNSKPVTNGWECEGVNTADAGTWNGNCYAVCARVPGR